MASECFLVGTSVGIGEIVITQAGFTDAARRVSAPRRACVNWNFRHAAR